MLIHHSLLERHSPYLSSEFHTPRSIHILVCSQQSLLNRQIKIQILDENPVLHALQSPPAAHPMLLPDPRHHKPPRRRERQRVHKPLLPKPDQKIAYNRNRTHFLQQLPVLRAVRHVRIPQSYAIIVASARQQIRSVQRRAAHDPTPRRVLTADWTHRIHPVRVLPLKTPKKPRHGPKKRAFSWRSRRDSAIRWDPPRRNSADQSSRSTPCSGRRVSRGKPSAWTLRSSTAAPNYPSNCSESAWIPATPRRFAPRWAR